MNKKIMMKKKETKRPAKSELEKKKNKSLRQKSGHPVALQSQNQKEFV